MMGSLAGDAPFEGLLAGAKGLEVTQRDAGFFLGLCVRVASSEVR